MVNTSYEVYSFVSYDLIVEKISHNPFYFCYLVGCEAFLFFANTCEAYFKCVSKKDYKILLLLFVCSLVRFELFLLRKGSKKKLTTIFFLQFITDS